MEKNLKVALIAAPHIPVPPSDYGGTELFVAHLAEALPELGAQVVVYSNGESTVNAERRWLYENSEWPIRVPEHAWARELNHYAWAVREASQDCDVLHVQSAQALAFSRFVKSPMVLTLHGPHDRALSKFYADYQRVQYVCISDDQCRRETMQNRRTIRHGINMSLYRLVQQKQTYLSFIGRIAPIKGTHLAIEVAKRTGIPLKIAGDVQPMYREYFEKKIKPHIDGQLVEYVGLADLNAKNELLGNSMAMLFPIQWNEPFGLVMVEAMACGTPVLAMPGGSVPEVIGQGISGYVCKSVVEMAKHARDLKLDPAAVRKYAEEKFSIRRMAEEYVAMYRELLRRT